MRWDAVIDLVSVTYGQDELRQQVAVPVKRTVFANEFTVGASEFYEAGQAGMRADREYQVRAVDYQGEELLEVAGERFRVVRVRRAGEFVRLVCEHRAGVSADDEVS